MEFFDLRNSANFNGYNPSHYLSSFSDTILKHISSNLNSDIENPFFCSLRLIKSSRSSVNFEIEISNDVTFNEREFLSEIGIVPKRFSKLKDKMSHGKIISFENLESNPELYNSQIDETQLNFEILKSEYAILKDSDIVFIEGSENPKPSAVQMCGCFDDESDWCCCEYEWNTYERFNDSAMSMDFDTTRINIKYDRKKWFTKFN